jgi:Abnormal spindle-like microcephaly-assoc'd, ASPM-SPD-2-Hydin/PQQ-like domain/Bacterial lectin
VNVRAAATLTAVAVVLSAALAGIPLIAAGPARADEYTISQNGSRDGWDSNEPLLSPAAVTSKRFGQVFDTAVNGQVYAQPLVVGDNVLVGTEDDYVYSINRETGAVNWSRQLGSPYASAAEDCVQTPVVLPYIGVTSAPVYDPGTGTLYVSGMLSGPPGDDSDLSTADPTYDLFALNEKTGAIEWKKQIAGSPTDNRANTFSAALEMQRTGLLLFNGSVYMGYGALCADGAADHNYVGYVAGVNTKSKAETLWTDQAYDPTDPGFYGGIWQGGGGLLSLGKSIYVATANGTAPPQGTPGADAPTVTHLGQSLVRLNVESNGSLRPADFYSPGDADRMTSVDHDFGSGGPILLPFGTKDYPQLLATADKEAVIFLLNPSKLGGRSSSPTGSTAVYTSSPSLVDNPSTLGDVDHGLWGHMAAFAGVGPSGRPTDYIYYEGTGWGSTDNMYVLDFDGANPAKPKLKNIGATEQSFGFSSGSPVITSDGATATSAIVWEVQSEDEDGTGGTLDAFSAMPTSAGVLKEIWSAPIGDAAQFTVPATSDGGVYVGARNDGSAAASGTNDASCPTDFESAAYTSTDSACVGDVYGFGIYDAQLAQLGATAGLGRVALGHTATRMVTLTNTGNTAVRITRITAPPVPFGLTADPERSAPIAAGASARIPVTFTPQAKGTATGRFVVITSDGFGTHATPVSVSGTGTGPARGTAVVPSPGGGWTLNGSAAMTGTTLRLTPDNADTTGSAVYYQPLPSNGLKVRFTARLTGADGLTLALLRPATSSVSAIGSGGGSLGFGGLSGVAVVLGTHRDTGDPYANFAGIATGTTGGHLKFAATARVPNLRGGTRTIGVTVSRGTISVTIDGTRYLSARIQLPAAVLPAFTAAAGSLAGLHEVSGVSVSAGAVTIPAPGGGWSFNGTADLAGSATMLTRAVPEQAGTVVYPRAVSTGALTATFSVAIGDGTGGAGTTFALLNRDTTATAVGRRGQGFGFAGLGGLAVVLGTQRIAGAPSADFVAIERGTAGGVPSILATASLSGIASLQGGVHTVTVSLKAGTMSVTIDGAVVLTQAVTVPSSAYPAFTASTGSLTDQHVVQDAAIAAG